MRIAILSWGTRGDIQPALAVGDELAARGHSVAVTVNTNLVEWARPSGLDVVPIPFDLARFFASSRGRAMLAAGHAAAFSGEVARREREVNRDVVRACVECCTGADLVVSTVMTAFRGPSLAERTGVPHGVLLTLPVTPTGAWSHVLSPVRDFRLAPLNRASYSLIYRMWWRDCAPNVAETRELLGLPPLASRPRVELSPAVGVFSPRLVPPPADWPAQQVVAGAIALAARLRERLGEASVPGDLDAWLAAGEPPVYFGFGSLPVLDPAGLLRQVAEITAHRGLRGLIGAGWTDFGDEPLPDHLFLCSEIDHERVLPRCRAAVHRGGAGTTAAALRAGLPALAVGVYADQPFWGWRLERAGVGAGLSYRRLTAARLDRALGRLLHPGAAARARALGAELRAEDGVRVAAGVIESWNRTRG